MKKAVIIYGPPGSGKGTQANLLAARIGLVHFDTGKFIEQLVYDPANKNNPEIQRERKNFDTGFLTTPSWVLKIVKNKVRVLAKAGLGVVFSGSPRTIFEAFGNDRTEGLVSVLEGLFGKDNVVPILLDIDPKVAILRNGRRLVCSVCGIAVLYNDAMHQHKTCPLCGAKLRKRTVDNPKVFGKRIKEYQERTEPILAKLKKRGYKINKVDGRPLPFKVHEKILQALN